MIDFRWNGGGEWNGKSWSAELPSDSTLVLYVFAAFVTAPHWKFAIDDQGKIDGPGDVLYVGRLPPRVKGKFTAILTTRLPKTAKGTTIQGLQLGTSEPLFSVSDDGETTLTETGQLGLLRIIVLFLFYVKRSTNHLGQCSLEYLRLDRVVNAKRRLHFIESLRQLNLW